MPEELFEVVPLGLNLRSSPEVTPGNRIAVLAQGTRVTKLADAADRAWWKVRAKIQGRPVEGFVAHRFLAPVSGAEPVPPPAMPAIPAVHLEEGKTNITRALHGGWAFPLGEAGRPNTPTGDAENRVRAIIKIVDWLAVDLTDRHRRWWKNGSTTYCNIYAYDLCYLSGCYLPRVWWKPAALLALARGETVTPKYDQTVFEIRANGLFDWLKENDASHGWQRSFSLDEVQDAANAGQLGLIVAQRHDLNRSGHITVVVPEHDGQTAARHAGKVERPLQSQAGASNRRWLNGPTAWWRGRQFRDFGFWLNKE